MPQETLVVTFELPFGRDWFWYADLNIVALSPRLDAAGRERALAELQEHWRTNCLRIVDGAA